MAWITGSATDYFDLLKQLRQIVTARHVASVAVNAGGTGYAVGDVLSVAGGTSTHGAKVEVTSVASGVVTGVRIANAGAYTVDPTTTANAVTGGGGSGCTVNLTVANTGWSVLVESQEAVSASISAGGSGYSVGDEIDVEGGAGIGLSDAVERATFVVTVVSGGAVSAVSVKSGSEGKYEKPPANAASTTAATGSGSGCKLTVTYQTIDDAQKVLVLEGAATGAPNKVQVGFRTYDGAVGTYAVANWALVGFGTAYDDDLVMHGQALMSPGLNPDGASDGAPETYGANLPLKNNDGGGTYPLDFYMSVTDRRIIMAVYCGTATIHNWVTMHTGFLNQFGSTGELPHPIYIAGSGSTMLTSALDNSALPPTTSIVHGITSRLDVDDSGPGFMLTPSGEWRQVATGVLSGATSFQYIDEYSLSPCGYVNIQSYYYVPGFPIVKATVGVDFQDMIELRVATTPAVVLMPTPDTTNTKQYALIPVNVIVGEGSGNDLGTSWYPFGELDGVFWFSYADGGAGADALDYMDIGGERYRVFRQGHRTELSTDFFVFKES